MTTLALLDGGSKCRTKKSNNSTKTKENVRPHSKISTEHLEWLRSQQSIVQQLYIDCITVDWAGSTPKFLKTSLDILGKSFRKAKSVLAYSKRSLSLYLYSDER